MIALVGIFGGILNVPRVKSIGTITILTDGTVSPDTESIENVANVYTFKENITDSIIVNKSDIVIDGRGNTTLNGDGMVGAGIYLEDVTNVIIKNMSDITNFEFGILLSNSSGCHITRNNITGNDEGIQLDTNSTSNIIDGNYIAHNTDDGIEIGEASSFNDIYDNLITRNHEDGVDIEDDSNTNQIHENTITYNGNEGEGDGEGVYIQSSRLNNITLNIISFNEDDGVDLDVSSYNLVYRNTITSNKDDAIDLDGCSNNEIFENLVQNNGGAVESTDSFGNGFFHNNFVDNQEQVILTGSANLWDDGIGKGNYWSDYQGEDTDPPYDIGDTPYVIDTNNQDNYPVMSNFHIWVKLPTSTSPAFSLPTDPLLYATIIIIVVLAVILAWLLKRR